MDYSLGSLCMYMVYTHSLRLGNNEYLSVRERERERERENGCEREKQRMGKSKKD